MFLVYFVALVPILGSFPAYWLLTIDSSQVVRAFDPMQFMMNVCSIIIALPLMVSYHKELDDKQSILANIRQSSNGFNVDVETCDPFWKRASPEVSHFLWTLCWSLPAFYATGNAACFAFSAVSLVVRLVAHAKEESSTARHFSVAMEDYKLAFPW